MTNEELGARHPELEQMRQFKTDHEVMCALQPGTTFMSTCIQWGRPARGIEGPHTVLEEWYYSKAFGACVSVRTDCGFILYPHLFELQNHPAKAVFTDIRQAFAFSYACQNAYVSDLEWQRFVDKRYYTHNKHVSTRNGGLSLIRCT